MKPNFVVTNVEPGDEIYKYYLIRERLWRLYDYGIWMDHESWFSVTPEILAEQLAYRIGYRGIILDLFSGNVFLFKLKSKELVFSSSFSF
jgi:hypothetical protein